MVAEGDGEDATSQINKSHDITFSPKGKPRQVCLAVQPSSLRYIKKETAKTNRGEYIHS